MIIVISIFNMLDLENTQKEKEDLKSEISALKEEIKEVRMRDLKDLAEMEESLSDARNENKELKVELKNTYHHITGE